MKQQAIPTRGKMRLPRQLTRKGGSPTAELAEADRATHPEGHEITLDLLPVLKRAVRACRGPLTVGACVASRVSLTDIALNLGGQVPLEGRPG